MTRIGLMTIMLLLGATLSVHAQVEWTDRGDSGFGFNAGFVSERIGRAYAGELSWIPNDAVELTIAVAGDDASGFSSSSPVPALGIAVVPFRTSKANTEFAVLTSILAGSDFKSRRSTSTGAVHADALLMRTVSSRIMLSGRLGYELAYRAGRDRFVDYIRIGFGTALDLSSSIRLCFLPTYSYPIGSGDSAAGMELSVLIH